MTRVQCRYDSICCFTGLTQACSGGRELPSGWESYLTKWLRVGYSSGPQQCNSSSGSEWTSIGLQQVQEENGVQTVNLVQRNKILSLLIGNASSKTWQKAS